MKVAADAGRRDYADTSSVAPDALDVKLSDEVELDDAVDEVDVLWLSTNACISS